MANDVTLVTALFDLGRGHPGQHLADYQRRPFAEYLSAFEQVLALDAPLCVYVPPELESLVWKHRDASRTRVIVQELEGFRQRFAFFDPVQRIRQDTAWRSQAEWLAQSPQANLAFYNPLVMSKMAMLNDQQLTNPFGTERYLWIDAGLARTCGGYLNQPGWLEHLHAALERFLFVCFPYIGGGEVHGYERAALARLAGTDCVRRVARGGLFGGSRQYIAQANALYWRLLELAFAQNQMGTEESIFAAMTYLEPTLFDRFEIAGDGLIGPFFEALLQGRAPLVRTDLVMPSAPAGAGDERKTPVAAASAAARPAPRPIEALSTAFYILTFNQPAQLDMLVQSWKQQPDFFELATVYVIDNSTREEAAAGNRLICQREGFRHLPQDNLGICGGRQFAAEHFEGTQHDYMVFLEDDMLLATPDMPACRSGFVRWVDGLRGKLLRLMEREQFDFLKLSFSEFYGVNAEQWAWYNVPQEVRRQVWPDQPELPQTGLAPRIPPVVFERLSVLEGLTCASGEVYYSNWPQIVGRAGNRRMFLQTQWARPYEQTWMSHLFQETRAGRLRPAVLLSSPIEHRRDFHYAPDERVES